MQTKETLDLLASAALLTIEQVDEDELRELAKVCEPVHVQGIQRVIQVHERLLSFVDGDGVH